MADLKVRYLVEKPGGVGEPPRFFWQPAKALRALGWRGERLLDPSGKPCTDAISAAAAAQIRNAELDAWRAGKLPMNAALASGPRPGTMRAVILDYLASPRFTLKREATKRGYRQNIAVIDEWAGDLLVRAITPGLVQKFYFSMQPRIPSKANAVIRMLRILCGHALRMDLIAINPAAKPGLIGTAPRLRIWSAAEIDHVVATGDGLGLFSIGDAILLAADFGQRQGDVLHMSKIRWSAPDAARQEDTGRIRLRQRKGTHHDRHAELIELRATPRLQARITQMFARHALLAQAHAAAEQERHVMRGHNHPPELLPLELPTLVICETTRRPYKPDHFRHEFATVRAEAMATMPSLIDALFMDLRDTAVTRMAIAGCTVPQITAVTGHTDDSAYTILRHYLAHNTEMADAAIAKLVAHEAAQRAAAEAAAGETENG